MGGGDVVFRIVGIGVARHFFEERFDMVEVIDEVGEEGFAGYWVVVVEKEGFGGAELAVSEFLAVFEDIV